MAHSSPPPLQTSKKGHGVEEEEGSTAAAVAAAAGEGGGSKGAEGAAAEGASRATVSRGRALLDSVTDIHYLDVGLNCRGAYRKTPSNPSSPRFSEFLSLYALSPSLHGPSI